MKSSKKANAGIKDMTQQPGRHYSRYWTGDVRFQNNFFTPEKK